MTTRPILHGTPVPTSRTSRRLLLPFLASVAFISLGLPDGLIGVAWPSIRASFGLPVGALGALLVTATTGYVASSFSSGRILAHVNLGGLLALSCLLTSISLFGYSITPVWAGMVALGLLAGLGAGAIDAGINTYAATRHGPGMLNWLHACYGLGAAAGPFIMTTVLTAGLPWQRGYALVAGGQAVLAGAFLITVRAWPRALAPHESASRTAARTIRSTLRLPAAWLGILVFFIYTGVEASAGAWAHTLFTEGRGLPVQVSGFWVGLYWGGLTAGRLLGMLAVTIVPVRHLIRLCLLAVAFGTALLYLDVTSDASFAGLVIMGLASGPIFPSLVATTPGRLGPRHTANGVGFQIAAAAFGQALLPALVGYAAGWWNLETIAVLLPVFAVLLFIAHEALQAAPPSRDPLDGLSRQG